MKNFSLWLENREEEALISAIRAALAGIAEDRPEVEWLNLDTSVLSPEILDNILSLGIVRDRLSDPEISDLRKQMESGIPIRSIIDIVLGRDVSPMPVETPPM